MIHLKKNHALRAHFMAFSIEGCWLAELFVPPNGFWPFHNHNNKCCYHSVQKLMILHTTSTNTQIAVVAPCCIHRHSCCFKKSQITLNLSPPPQRSLNLCYSCRCNPGGGGTYVHICTRYGNGLRQLKSHLLDFELNRGFITCVERFHYMLQEIFNE